MKNSMTAMVIFNVGVTHPLYEKPILAEITSSTCGYNGRQIYAKTVEEVYFPEDKKGIGVYDKNGKFIRYEVRPAFSKIWEGYVKSVIL